MPAISLESVKQYLRVTHNSDDETLTMLIDAAEAEALNYMDRKQLPRRGETAVDECDSNDPTPVSDADDLARDVWLGCVLIVQGGYEGKDVAEMAAVRQLAEIKWQPYRNQWGV